MMVGGLFWGRLVVFYGVAPFGRELLEDFFAAAGGDC